MSIPFISISVILISCVPSIPTPSTPHEYYSHGLYYRTGFEEFEQDYVKSAANFKLAAMSGYSAAQLELGDIYRAGLGVKQDYIEARAWYLNAARQDDVFAQHAQSRLGDMYREGIGVEKDSKTAVEWYIQAADQGHFNSQLRLGVMHEEGVDVEQDYEKARYWYEQAAKQGDTFAQSKLEDLPEQTTSNNSDTQPAQTPSATSTTNTLQGNIGQVNDLASAIDSITCGNGDFDNLRTILPIYNNIPDLKDALNSAFAGDFQTMYATGKAQGLQTSNLLQQGRDAKEQFEQNRDSSIQALNQWLTVDPVAWIAAIDAGTADAFIFGDASQGPLGQDANWSRSYLIAQYSLARINMIIACYEGVE